jgi:hypothetical protein
MGISSNFFDLIDLILVPEHKASLWKVNESAIKLEEICQLGSSTGNIKRFSFQCSFIRFCSVLFSFQLW